MKRIQEKVKDLIDVRPYEVLPDLISDPAQTLSIYHFTDITSDLMAQWLDKVAGVGNGKGKSSALAGYRGVGKSHFLGALGAIVSQPELRSRISDAHVAGSAERLRRKRHPVAYVRRGIFDSFTDELRAAISKVLEFDVTSIESLSELLHLAAEKADDVPFVLIIDTAFERTSRVSRDDGPILSEIAEIAKDLNIFVGVALDDDIAGADGANAAITRTYTIDYLDQEHLYKIVNTYIFPKHRQTLPLLHEIYTDFRKILPSFRWSEQRFTALYPLHPVTLEIASYIRLYAQDFALLSFTSSAGNRIMGRPANSLIALDEVFDSVEASLRKVSDLKDAFLTYDKLNSEVISKVPIMQRMQAKLILKGLLLLSLDGYGTTVGEITAAMLIFNEESPNQSITEVRNLLETFVSSFPDSLGKLEEEGRETRYSLKISNKDDLNKSLSNAIESISKAVIPKILRRVGRDKFPEWVLPSEVDGQHADVTDCEVVWRGGLRNGRIVWDLESDNWTQDHTSDNSEVIDWEVVISSNVTQEIEAGRIARVRWHPAGLTEEESDTILRYFVLLTNSKLRDEYGEVWQVAGHTHTVNVEKIWHRLFVQDAKFIVDGVEYSIPEEAMLTLTLSELLSQMLEPLFEVRYPSHPIFAEPLQMNDVATLVNDFFSGAKQTGSDIQNLAETFALPLGLVTPSADTFVHETDENIVNLPYVQEVLELINRKTDESVSLEAVSERLRQLPFGLMKEAQYLILSALVAHRQIEFVTSKGDRINRRSLDLKIIWDDIVGIAKPSGTTYGISRLTEWAKILGGGQEIQSIDNPEDIATIKLVFEEWLKNWESNGILARFDELPDEIFNTKIWRFSVNSQKTFGIVASTIREILADTISLEDGLLRIADAFSDSETVYDSCKNDFTALEDFVNTVEKRGEISIYLAVCGATENSELENTREKLLQVIDKIYFNPDKTLSGEMDALWKEFHESYTEHFTINHDLVMKSQLLQEQYNEIRRSDEWWEFEGLASIDALPDFYWKEVREISGKFKELNCRFNAKEMLKTHPFCACSFSLAKANDWESMPQTLKEKLAAGRAAYRNILRNFSSDLNPLLEDFARRNQSEEITNSSRELAHALTSDSVSKPFDTTQLTIMKEVCSLLPGTASVEAKKVNSEVSYSVEENWSERDLVGTN